MLYFQMTGGGLPSDDSSMPYCTFGSGANTGNAFGQGEITGDSCFPIGLVAQQSWEIDTTKPPQVIRVTFSGGQEGRQAVLSVTCDPAADDPTFAVKGETRTLVYEVGITSKFACEPPATTATVPTTIATTAMSTTTTTTMILPVNADCDPRNDHCSRSEDLYCDRTSYKCRYGTTTTSNIRTTATTSTALLCNGKPDPAMCAADAGKCTDAVAGSSVRLQCPSMCDACIPDQHSGGSFPAYIYGAVGGGAALLLLLLGAIWRCARKQKLNRLRSRYGDDAGDGVQLLDLEGTHASSQDYFDPQMTLPRKSISLGDVIGQGNFGKVYAGTAKDPQRGGSKIFVAIKSPSPTARLEFEAEMEIMGQLTRLGGHPHIVGVVGCVYGDRPLLVLEFCAGGSLKAALTAVRTFKGDAAAADAPRHTFEATDLTTCAHQVALAMAFLERHTLLHRDLAARNVLLTGPQQQGQLECKLADFGLSRRVAPGSDYYRRTVGTSAPIPVRWMAPESLEDGVSTINSDKWSFGVLLWEIYSLGLRPYIGVANHEMAKHLRKGHRLDQPSACPDEVYAGVMQQCWEVNPAARPAFDVIGHRLHGLIAATNA